MITDIPVTQHALIMTVVWVALLVEGMGLFRRTPTTKKAIDPPIEKSTAVASSRWYSGTDRIGVGVLVPVMQYTRGRRDPMAEPGGNLTDPY